MTQIPQAATTGLTLGDVAPDFEARSTQGPVRLSAYQGGWVMLFAHPADFTPVCTSEFVALARLQDDFAMAGCSLIGVSVDSIFSHLAWLRDIETHFSVRIDFPVIEDPSLAISRAYGMLGPHAGSSASVRATVLVDPHGVVRLMTHYPLTLGRDFNELLRCLVGLQESDRLGCVLPAGWRPGDPALAPAPEIHCSTDHAPAAGNDVLWYYRPFASEGSQGAMKTKSGGKND